jgi:hypothetical protein
MGTVRGLLKWWVALLLGGLVIAAPASAASSFETLFHTYQQTGTIASCKYTVGELQSAYNQVPPDIEQYAPDFPAALQAALQARARGVCGGKGSVGTVPAKTTKPAPPAKPSPAGVTPAPTPSASVPSPIAAAAAAAPSASGSDSGKVALTIVAALMAALALAAVCWTVAVLRGREPAWMGSAGHALGEVRLRAGGALREFADWIRLGR